MGLNDEAYANIRTQVLALDPLPLLDRIFNMVQQEATHKQIMLGHEQQTENVITFAVKDHPGMVERLICKHYRRRGHKEES